MKADVVCCSKDRITLLIVTTSILLLRDVFGADRLSYVPAELGCFPSPAEGPALTKLQKVDRETLSQEVCIDHCIANEMTLAGLQYGHTCACSDTFPDTGDRVPNQFCRATCSGDIGQYCGGEGYMFLFSVCDAQRYGPNCDLPCFCESDFPCDFMTGVCLNGKCNSNFLGPRCDEKKTSAVQKALQWGTDRMKQMMGYIRGYFVADAEPPENCPRGYYGPMCKALCHCAGQDVCDRLTGCCPGACAPGWVGKRCDKPDSCRGDVVCHNGGTCIMEGFRMRCQCITQYSGFFCENKRPCADRPCKNGGVCSNKGYEYTCACQGDFTDSTCSTDLSAIPVSPSHLGCFNENPKQPQFDLKMQMETNDLSPTKCARRCMAKTFTYAGLKSPTECYCSQQHSRYGVAELTRCTFSCKGDINTKCGGGDDVISVYSVCPYQRFGLDCKAVCYCLVGQCHIKIGVCPTEQCQVGYTGVRCDEPTGEVRDKYTNNRKIILYMIGGFGAMTFVQALIHTIIVIKITLKQLHEVKEKPLELELALQEKEEIKRRDELQKEEEEEEKEMMKKEKEKKEKEKKKGKKNKKKDKKKGKKNKKKNGKKGKGKDDDADSD